MPDRPPRSQRPWAPAGAGTWPRDLGVLVAAGSILLPLAAAQAGTGGTEFEPFYDTLVDWVQGSLGKSIALAMFLVGVAVGVVRGSIIAAVPAVAASLALFIAPDVIDAIVTATLPGAGPALTLPAVEIALDRLG